MGLFTGIISGLATGITSYVTSQNKARAYKSAANQISEAAKEYSGREGLNRSIQAGLEENSRVNNLNQQLAATKASNADNPMAGAVTGMGNVANAASNSGYSLGFGNQQARNQSKLSAAKTKADAALKQADVDYNVGNQAVQSGLQGLGEIAKTYNLVSDENAKTDPYDKTGLNNDSGLPNATIDDALSKLETVTYKYKSGMGLDNEDHVGLIAQSCLKSPLFEDCVVKQENGYLALDKAKLMSKLPMIMSNIKDRIDALYLQSNK